MNIRPRVLLLVSLSLLAVSRLAGPLRAAGTPIARMWLEGAVGTPGERVDLCLKTSYAAELKAISASIAFGPKVNIDAAELTASGLTAGISCDGVIAPLIPDFFHAEQGPGCVAL